MKKIQKQATGKMKYHAHAEPIIITLPAAAGDASCRRDFLVVIRDCTRLVLFQS